MATYFHVYRNGSRLTLASMRERLVAQLIDAIALSLICNLILSIFSLGEVRAFWVSPIVPIYLLEVGQNYVPTTNAYLWGGDFVTVSIPYLRTVFLQIPSPLLILVYAAYYIGFTSKYSQTPGKMLKQLVVVNERRKIVTTATAVQRYLVSIISFLLFGLGFWVAARDEKIRAWHDRLVGSEVCSFNNEARVFSDR